MITYLNGMHYISKGLEARGAGNRLSLPVKKDAEADMYQFLISNKNGESD